LTPFVSIFVSFLSLSYQEEPGGVYWSKERRERIYTSSSTHSTHKHTKEEEQEQEQDDEQEEDATI